MDSKPEPSPSGGAETLIRARNLSKRFGDFYAVRELDFELPNGVIFGLIGPSGCGKTTTIRLLNGYYAPSEGEAEVFGKDPVAFTRHDRERIGYLPQLFVLYPDLTVWENLNFAASVYGVSLRRMDLLLEILEFVELQDHRGKLVRDISGGMRRRLSLAATLVHQPDLLFLDEPTAGIDPVLRRKFWDYFKRLQDEGRTMLVTTQYVGEAAYCDLVGVMVEGRLLMVETPEGLRHQAYGGDIVKFRTRERLTYQHREELSELPFTLGHVDRVDENEVQFAVQEAAEVFPHLVDWSKERGMEIVYLEEYLPPFDDVFVELIESHRQIQGTVRDELKSE